MQKEKRLRQKIEELQEQWDLLGEKLSKLEHDRIIKADPEQQFQLEQTIATHKTERESIERQLEELEAQFDAEYKKPSGEGRVQVFISYCHREPDNSLAHAFSEALEQAGHQVFIDKGIQWGADWAREIQKALAQSDYLVVLLSRESAARETVVEEVAIAKELARRNNGIPVILPIRICYPFSEPLPYQLSMHLHQIHQMAWEQPLDTERLVPQLLSTIAGRTAWQSDMTEQLTSGSAKQVMPQAQFDPRDLIMPGDVLDVESNFYIRRKADTDVLNAVKRPRAIVTIHGPSQTGKTSLMMRVYATIRAERLIRAAFIDFQAFPHKDFASLNTIWREIAVCIAEQLVLEKWNPTQWKPTASYQNNFSTFLDRIVFGDQDTPLLLCFDKVDSVFKSDIKADFFASVRSFYNNGAYDPTWKKVRWILATSSEPSFFIEDTEQSPFNIGLRVNLKMFTAEEVDGFARRYGLVLQRPEIDNIIDYTGGRPYLVHLLLHHLVRAPNSRDQLFDAKTAGKGIFRDHLHRYLMHFQQEQELTDAMKSVIEGKCCNDVRIAHRLEAAGLIRQDEEQRILPLCRLYAEFFKEALSK